MRTSFRRPFMALAADTLPGLPRDAAHFFSLPRVASVMFSRFSTLVALDAAWPSAATLASVPGKFAVENSGAGWVADALHYAIVLAPATLAH